MRRRPIYYRPPSSPVTALFVRPQKASSLTQTSRLPKSPDLLRDISSDLSSRNYSKSTSRLAPRAHALSDYPAHISATHSIPHCPPPLATPFGLALPTSSLVPLYAMCQGRSFCSSRSLLPSVLLLPHRILSHDCRSCFLASLLLRCQFESHKSVPILPAVSAFHTLPALSLLIIGQSYPSLLFSYIYVCFATARNNRSPVIHFSRPLLLSLCAKL